MNPAPREAYLKGRYFWNKSKEQDLSKSLDYFNQAIRLDPAYPLGYVGLADSYVTLGIFGLRPRREVFPKAREAARKALELDETQGEAHSSLAEIETDYDWDWAAAEKEHKTAIELNPNYATTAHNRYANLLSILRRHQEAIAEAKRARELDPLSYIMNGFVGGTCFKAGRYQEATEECHKGIELEPSLPFWHRLLARAYEQQHALSEAIAEDEKGVSLSGGGPPYVASLGYAYGLSGDRTKTLALLRKLEAMSKRRYVSPLDIAVVYTGLGDVA